MTDWQNRIVGHGTQAADQFIAHPNNPRVHPQKQRDAMKGSLDSLGWIAPVIVNKTTGYMIDGHERVWQALQNDNAAVPFIEVELDEHEEALALASFDFITYMAQYDRDNLDALLQQVNTDNTAMQSLLSELAEDNGLYFGDEPEVIEAPEAQIDRAEELLQKWGVVAGDILEIPSQHGGVHRLMCGDSTSAKDVALLMGEGERPSLMVTDPPYGVDYSNVIDGRGNQKQGGWSEIANDALSSEELEELLKKSLSAPNCLYGFVFHPPGEKRWAFWNAATHNGWRVAQEIIWVKNSLVFGRADYQWRHEPCLYLKRNGARRQDDRTQTTVWEVNKPTNSEHPTQKPTELFCIPIRNHTEISGIVYDPFLGSGTTMVAAETLKRVCFGMELEPKYCAVILERMSDMGLEPRKVN